VRPDSFQQSRKETVVDSGSASIEVSARIQAQEKLVELIRLQVR
jgi:hypothetical protein